MTRDIDQEARDSYLAAIKQPVNDALRRGDLNAAMVMQQRGVNNAQDGD